MADDLGPGTVEVTTLGLISAEDRSLRMLLNLRAVARSLEDSIVINLSLKYSEKNLKNPKNFRRL